MYVYIYIYNSGGKLNSICLVDFAKCSVCVCAVCDCFCCLSTALTEP